MSLTEQLAPFAPETVATPGGAVAFRRARSPGFTGGVTHVLLHGIGSASGSWLAQLLWVERAITLERHVLAWDAPGYGDSAALPMESPCAVDYAKRFWTWIDLVTPKGGLPFTMVGHSLGALMAAGAALQRPERVKRLVLLAPALGYASASAAVREQKLSDRLANLARLGPAGMAKQRAAAMLSPNASKEQIALVETVMAGIHPHGYTQAARMLAGGDVLGDLKQLRCQVSIASGSADTVTPPDACAGLAQKIGVAYESLGEVGHSCALEAAVEVNRVIGIDRKEP